MQVPCREVLRGNNADTESETWIWFENSPKLSHSDMSLISFHMLTPRNHASLQRCPSDSLNSAHRTAHGLGTSSCDR